MTTAIASATDDGDELTLVRWYRPDGAVVAADEPICALETARGATMDLAAPTAGVLRHFAGEGDRVATDGTFVRVDPIRSV